VYILDAARIVVQIEFDQVVIISQPHTITMTSLRCALYGLFNNPTSDPLHRRIQRVILFPDLPIFER